jgi:hypothetical protein
MTELQNLYCILLSIRDTDSRADIMAAIEQALFILDKMNEN